MARPTAKQLNVLVGQANWETAFAGTIPASTGIIVTSVFAGATPAGSNTVVGVYTTAIQNKIMLRNRATQKPFQDSLNRQIIGRLTESIGVWTIAFYVIISGAETPYNFTGNPDVGANFDFRWCETVQLKDSLPTNVVNFGEGIDEIDPSSPLTHLHQVDYFTATALQTVFAFSATPKDYTDVAFFVNGIRYKYTTDFTAAGASANWLDVDFTLAAGDIVTLEYAKA
jgi:hypothetical protein